MWGLAFFKNQFQIQIQYFVINPVIICIEIFTFHNKEMLLEKRPPIFNFFPYSH